MSIYGIIKEKLDAGRQGMLATVIARTGSAPRDVGAKMFVAEDGSSYGTVGGGSLEHEVQKEAVERMNDKRAVIVHVRMDAKTVEAQGMICGGNVDVLIEPVTREYSDLYGRLAVMETRGRMGVIVTGTGPEAYSKTLVEDNLAVSGDPVGERQADRYLQYLQERKTVLVDGGSYIVEPVIPRVPLYIFGGGHISQYIVKMAKMVDFYVIVIDDREEFANQERFPDADEVRVDDFTGVFSDLPFTGEEFVVIVTRGHSHDADVLKAVLAKNTRYIGMIGSRRKVKMIFDLMRRNGFDENAISSVRAPIGLPIHAETPQEIAVSIVGQLVEVRGEKVSDG